MKKQTQLKSEQNIWTDITRENYDPIHNWVIIQLAEWLSQVKDMSIQNLVTD